jgi:hypothetical protein
MHMPQRQNQSHTMFCVSVTSTQREHRNTEREEKGRKVKTENVVDIE